MWFTYFCVGILEFSYMFDVEDYMKNWFLLTLLHLLIQEMLDLLVYLILCMMTNPFRHLFPREGWDWEGCYLSRNRRRDVYSQWGSSVLSSKSYSTEYIFVPLTSLLILNPPYVVKIAVDKGFTKGRRTPQVASSCLYLACR